MGTERFEGNGRFNPTEAEAAVSLAREDCEHPCIGELGPAGALDDARLPLDAPNRVEVVAAIEE